MAEGGTDVELPHTHTVMDFFKTDSSFRDFQSGTPTGTNTCNKKEKGILGFFTTLPKSSSNSKCSSGAIDNDLECTQEKNDQKKKKTKIVNGKEAEIFDNDLNISMSELSSSKCTSSVVSNGEETEGKSAETAPFEAKSDKSVPDKMIMKKKLSMKKKKMKEKNEPQEHETLEPDNCKEEVSETGAKPVEIDYADFIKTLTQGGNNAEEEETQKVNGDISSKTSFEVQASSVESCVEKKKTGKTQPESNAVNKPKSKNASNAFSLLMQAGRGNRNVKSSEDGSSFSESIDDHKEIGNDTVDALSVEDSVDAVKDPVPERNSTPSVMNFFTKCKKKTDCEEDGGTPVLVQVDVHRDSNGQKSPPRSEKSKTNVQRRKSEKSAKIEDEIVFLGSETITIDECETQDTRKGKNKVHCENADFSQKTKEIEKVKCPQSAVLSSSEKTKFLQDTTPQSFAKKAQATLQFGKSGSLSVKAAAKEKLKDTEQSDLKDDCEKGAGLPLSRLRTRNNTQVKHSQVSQEVFSNGGEKEEASSSKTSGKGKRKISKTPSKTRTSAETGNGADAKHFTPRSKCVLTSSKSKSRAKELLQKAKQQKNKKVQQNPKKRKLKTRVQTLSKIESEEMKREPSLEAEADPCEQSGRRQSRRLAEQQKVKLSQEAENCISVESCSDCEEVESPRKQKAGRKTSLSTSLKYLSAGQSVKKNGGKLAPIFSMRKPGAAKDETPEQPVEDPEVVKKRREFLMSGVPSELKRQAANAAPVIVASEYAPFPEVSHTQQRGQPEDPGLDLWSLPAPQVSRVKPEGEATNEVQASSLEWAKLDWSTTASHQRKSFALNGAPSNCPSPDTVAVLLKELQLTNQAFPFSDLYGKLKAQFGISTVKKMTETVDNKHEVKAKRGRRRKSGNDSDIVIVDDMADKPTAQGDRDSQWPDVLQPKSASEVIGNESSVRRLRFWLEEWKALIKREACLSATRKADDSDFDLSEEDSDGESSGLCNTMLLVGPHGVGKTTAVYALAHQLSFKVFEVNASSSRQGRHILAQLQEATQSHQVAQKKDGVAPPPTAFTALSKATDSSKDQLPGKKKAKTGEKAVPSAFASFFKKSALGAEGKSSPKKKKGKESPQKPNTKKDKETSESSSRKRKKESVEVEVSSPKKVRVGRKSNQSAVVVIDEEEKGGDEGNLAGCLNLTSTSLILFDEVDLVFEEDTGFLQTVQHFINTTKIPIVMTTSDPSFERQLHSKVECLFFRPLPLASLVSYLQTVCLVVGLRTSRDDVQALATLCQGDLRRGLLSLHYLILSGGGLTQEPCSARVKAAESSGDGSDKKPQSESEKRIEPAAPVDSDGEGDFVCLKPLRKKPRRILDDEDGGHQSAQTVSEDAKAGSEKRNDDEKVISADLLPSVHLHLFESFQGISNNLKDLFRGCVQTEYISSAVQALSSACLKMQVRCVDTCELNLLTSLPLPMTSMPPRWRPPPSSIRKATKRKRIRSDLFDSEGSDDDSKAEIVCNGSVKSVVESNCDPKMSSELQQECKEALQTSEERKAEVEMGEERTETSCKQVIKIDVERKKEMSGTTESSGKVVEMDTSASPAQDCGSVGAASGQEEFTALKETPSLRASRECADGGLGSQLLSSFARYYETLSSIDLGHCHQRSAVAAGVRDSWRLVPGIEDVASREGGWRGEDGHRSGDLGSELDAEVGMRSSRHLWQSMNRQLELWRGDKASCSLPDGCSLPMQYPEAASSSKFAFGPDVETAGESESCRVVAKSVLNSLPLTAHSNLDVLNLDYLPALRAISQAERFRQISKTKRRFHHHFSSIGLCLNQATVKALCTEFPSALEDMNSSTHPVIDC